MKNQMLQVAKYTAAYLRDELKYAPKLKKVTDDIFEVIVNEKEYMLSPGEVEGTIRVSGGHGCEVKFSLGDDKLVGVVCAMAIETFLLVSKLKDC